MKPSKYKIIVLGIGNILLSDDGLGPKVIKQLKKEDWGEKILLLDCGTSPLNHLKQLSNSQYVIIIDAIRGRNSVGTIYQFELSRFNLDLNHRTTAHDYSLPQVIELAQEINDLPQQVFYYGIEPANLDLGTELSKTVKKSIPKLVKELKNKINNLNNKN